jgi:HPt (histidine-containing phosphotransfer) domain-containing protein
VESLGERLSIEVTQQRGEEVRAALKRVWLDSRPAVLERLATLERFSGNLRSGVLGQTGCEAALAAAHKLSGTLGMFGFGEASACAAEIESMLAGDSTPEGSRLAELVTRLTGLLEKAEGTEWEKPDS